MKIGDVLSDINLNNDYFMKNIFEKLSDLPSKQFYSQIIKLSCSMIEKGINIDKINFVFKSYSNNDKSFDERISRYQAFCVFDMNERFEDILDSTDYIRDMKRKKPLKSPEFDNELKVAKLFQPHAELPVLIYNKTAEFIIRNKILESCLRCINSDMETKPIFKLFNDLYEKSIISLDLMNKIQSYSFKIGGN